MGCTYNAHALGPHRVAEHLGAISRRQGCVDERVRASKEEDERHPRVADCEPRVGVVFKAAGEARHTGEEACQHNATHPEFRSPPDEVVGGGSCYGACAGDNGVHESQQEAALCRSNSDSGVHRGEIVG